MAFTDWMLIALCAGPPIVAGFWWCCCGQTSDCSTVLTGWCFQFSISGVANTSLGGCQYCPDLNGTWLLVPDGPITVGPGCSWHTCRPPVCCPPEVGYPTPVVFTGLWRWTLIGGGIVDGLQLWNLSSGCGEVQYLFHGPINTVGPNIFTLLTPASQCQYWPATISVTGIPPLARGSQTKIARTFSSVGSAPGEGGGRTVGPSPWTPETIGIVHPNPYCNNSFPVTLVTDWLICSNFGFTIPGAYWVTGISIKFKRWADQAGVVFDETVSVGLNYNIANWGNVANVSNEASAVGWPLFSNLPEDQNPDYISYGGQYDQWNQGSLAVFANEFIDTPDWSFAINAQTSAGSPPAIHVDPTTCEMTVYYVSVPCGDNCCACPPVPSTGNPPSAYKITFPSIGSGCADHPIGVLPGCDCAFVSGQTFELPYNSLLSVPTYRCVYSVTIGYWGFSLTITNISPDARQFDFVAGTSSACALPNEDAAGGFFVCSVQASGPNLAISQCGAISLYPTFDAFNCYCGLVIQIGGNSHASLITVEAVPVT